MALFQRQNVVLRSPDLLFLLIIENKSLQFNKDDWTLSLSKSGVFFSANATSLWVRASFCGKLYKQSCKLVSLVKKKMHGGIWKKPRTCAPRPLWLIMFQALFSSVGYVSLTPKFLITFRWGYFSACVPDFSPSSFQTTPREKKL